MRKGILLQPKASNFFSFSFSTSRTTWSREEILTALNDRLLMNRRTERLGLRRCLLACGAFLVYKFVTSRVLGTSTQSGGGMKRAWANIAVCGLYVRIMESRMIRRCFLLSPIWKTPRIVLLYGDMAFLQTKWWKSKIVWNERQWKRAIRELVMAILLWSFPIDGIQ